MARLVGNPKVDKQLLNHVYGAAYRSQQECCNAREIERRTHLCMELCAKYASESEKKIRPVRGSNSRPLG